MTANPGSGAGARPSDIPPRLQDLAAILALGLGFGAYFVLRYQGLWAENDTAVFTRAIAGMQSAESFYYPRFYIHGYGYSVWSSTLAMFTGLEVRELVQVYMPMIGTVFLGVFGFATFRRLLESTRLGLLAAAILFLVPELVFTVTRGNHEKLTVSLTLFALMALINSFVEMLERRRWRVFATWVIVFYATSFTLVTINIFFGSSFIVATTLTLLFGFVAVGLRPSSLHVLRPLVLRLMFAAGIGWLLVLLVAWYVYPSTGTSLRLVQSVFERVSALFFGANADPLATRFADPYAVAGTDWASRGVYVLLSSFRWTLFAGSFVAWCLLLRRTIPRLEQAPPQRIFLMALYGAFGIQLAVAVPTDFLGLYAGTNLQVRIYTYFALLAAPMFAYGIHEAMEHARGAHARRVVATVIAVILVAFAPLSLLKATLDPAVSNRWHFYRIAETQAMRFWDERHTFGFLWVDVDARLRYAYAMEYPEALENENTFDIQRPDPITAQALRSPIVTANAAAWRRELPSIWLDNLVYDNGTVQIYHRSPDTPFQR